jgi:hypothetical protein
MMQGWTYAETQRLLFFLVAVLGEGMISLTGVPRAVNVLLLWDTAVWQSHMFKLFERPVMCHRILESLSSLAVSWTRVFQRISRRIERHNPDLAHALESKLFVPPETCAFEIQRLVVRHLDVPVPRKTLRTMQAHLAGLPAAPPSCTDSDSLRSACDDVDSSVNALACELSDDMAQVIAVLDGAIAGDAAAAAAAP